MIASSVKQLKLIMASTNLRKHKVLRNKKAVQNSSPRVKYGWFQEDRQQLFDVNTSHSIKLFQLKRKVLCFTTINDCSLVIYCTDQESRGIETM